MKPHRMCITHELASVYGMLDKMHVLVSPSVPSFQRAECNRRGREQRPKRASPEDMTAFHTDEYIHFLANVTPETVEKMTYQKSRCMFPPSCALEFS